ncbi:MAG: hypothetical protein H6621_00045 [Halobacteriovoraceae bacterium]|nr:hypothetical protein [Halobacteriovoraceae bacterium]MCB9093430.1 hypothetical protein [Halobacteriovoraceae bacterium]
MQANIKSSISSSISHYAKRRARRLALKIFFAGFFSVFVTGISIGFYNHYVRVTSVMDILGHSLAQPIVLGGDYVPRQLLSSLIKTPNLEDAWLYSSKGNLLADDHTDKTEELPLGDKRGRLFFWKNGTPFFLISKEIDYHGQEVGKIYFSYEVPLASIFYLAIGISFLFSILSYYMIFGIRRLADKIAEPLVEFTGFLEEKVDTTEFMNSAQKWKFKEIQILHKKFAEYLQKAKKAEAITRKSISDAQVAKIASQVKHDVKASLFIGEAATDRIQNGSSSEFGILKSVFERIRNTIDDIPKLGGLTDRELDSASYEDADEDDAKDILRRSHIASLINQIVAEVKFAKFGKEKRIAFSVEFVGDAFHSFCEVEPSRFKRSLVNIYKNAIEAILDEGHIQTVVESNEGLVSIEIKDNGRGISPDILKELGKPGVTFNKSNGTGIGLSSTIENLDRWDGKLKIDSKEGFGTSVTLTLPESEEDFLYPTQITLSSAMQVIVVDDDPTVHALWQQRFNRADIKRDNINVHHFTGFAKAKAKIDEFRRSGRDFLLLVDNDLRSSEGRGVDFVKELNVQGHALLVTSDGHSRSVYATCEALSLPIIPKVIQKEIPIHISLH